MESFFASLKTEHVHQVRFHTREEARTAVFEYIEIFYNRQRLHSAVGYRTPAEARVSMEGIAMRVAGCSAALRPPRPRSSTPRTLQPGRGPIGFAGIRWRDRVDLNGRATIGGTDAPIEVKRRFARGRLLWAGGRGSRRSRAPRSA